LSADFQPTLNAPYFLGIGLEREWKPYPSPSAVRRFLPFDPRGLPNPRGVLPPCGRGHLGKVGKNAPYPPLPSPNKGLPVLEESRQGGRVSGKVSRLRGGNLFGMR